MPAYSEPEADSGSDAGIHSNLPRLSCCSANTTQIDEGEEKEVLVKLIADLEAFPTTVRTATSSTAKLQSPLQPQPLARRHPQGGATT